MNNAIKPAYGLASYITKTCLYNFDPLKPHFYIVKLGFTVVYIIFLISAQKHRLWYSLEPPRRGGSNKYHNLCFEQKYEKYQSFLPEKFHFLVVKFSIYLNRRVFVMNTQNLYYIVCYIRRGRRVNLKCSQKKYLNDFS